MNRRLERLEAVDISEHRSIRLSVNSGKGRERRGYMLTGPSTATVRSAELASRRRAILYPFLNQKEVDLQHPDLCSERFKMTLLSGARGPAHNEALFAQVIHCSSYPDLADRRVCGAECTLSVHGIVRGCRVETGSELVFIQPARCRQHSTAMVRCADLAARKSAPSFKPF